MSEPVSEQQPSGGGEIPAAAQPVQEIKPVPLQTEEVKNEPAPTNAEVKEEKSKSIQTSNAEAQVETVAKNGETDAAKNGDANINWQKQEAELRKIIQNLESTKTENNEDRLRMELKVREEEIDLLKTRVKSLETELQAALSRPGGGKNQEMIDNIKQQHEELLSKARGMIFDKTKMVKNQELQIEALSTQVKSLKDINQITKDLLEIRNSEMKAMEERLQAMEARFQAEKDRFKLVLQRAQAGTAVNDDLKKEYDAQLAIFKELRVKYDERVKVLAAENTRLKERLEGLPGPSEPAA